MGRPRRQPLLLFCPVLLREPIGSAVVPRISRALVGPSWSDPGCADHFGIRSIVNPWGRHESCQGRADQSGSVVSPVSGAAFSGLTSTSKAPGPMPGFQSSKHLLQISPQPRHLMSGGIHTLELPLLVRLELTRTLSIVPQLRR